MKRTQQKPTEEQPVQAYVPSERELSIHNTEKLQDALPEYDIAIDGGVAMIRIQKSDAAKVEEVHGKLTAAVMKTGYNGSYGVKTV